MVRQRWFLWLNYLLPLVPLFNTIFTSAIKPDSSFKDYFLTYPRVYHAREKRSVSSSSDYREETGHIHHLVVELNLAGKNVTLDLQLNRNLIPKHYFEKYQKNGDYVTKKPNLDDEKIELCHYNGHVRNVADSWVAVSTCDGIKGVVYDGNELLYVESMTGLSTDRSGTASLDGPHFIYRHSDLASNFSCGFRDPLPSPYHTISTAHTRRFKRNAPDIRGPYNANNRSRYIELVLVLDHQFYQDYDKDMHKINQRCKDLANIINSLYEPLNIFVALVGVVIWTERNEIVVEPDGDRTLTNFLLYRKNLINDHPNDNAQFLTGSPFNNNVVGKALKGPICTFEFSGGVNVDHSKVVGMVATTIAHEMGHNLGMEHDNETDNTCKCPKERCIMAPSSSSLSPTDWSSCSQEYLALAFEHGMDYCLRNKPTSLFDGPVCGNGFVEHGEQCDCGLKEKCTNICCDPTTCTLHENATCATGECCDLQTCKPRSPGTVCRWAEHECDLAEYCNGESEYCPEDVFKIDGESCASGKAFCYQGNCRSRTDQCKVLWGPSGSSSHPKCYELNSQGSMYGNCGYNRQNNSFQKCNDQDIECGMLQCKHATEKLQFGTEVAARLPEWFITTDELTIACRSAIIDLGLSDIDPGLTPNGAKCGDNKMCWNRKCMPVDTFRKLTVPNACPNNCNGNGICNSRGHCHCNNGYAPPDCDESGAGGSVDSGPAEDPRNYNKLRTIFWYMMLTLIPLVLILLLYPRYVRKSPSYFWKRNQRRTVLCEKTVHTKTANVYANGADGTSGPRQSLVGAETKPKTGGDEPSHSLLQDSLLGNFKGFSIVPLTQNTSSAPTTVSPLRPAPKSPPVASQTISPKIVRAAPLSPPPTTIMQLPHLPPQNRPLISSPVLDNTTSTAAKKLINRVKPVVRPAPAPPVCIGGGVSHINKQQLSSNTVSVLAEPISCATEKPAKEQSYVTLSRIASLISKSPPSVTPTAPKAIGEKRDGVVAQKAAKIDRDTLKKLKISDPIPLSEPSIPVEPLSKVQEKGIVMRAQSMRQAKKTQRSAVHSFGSMRLPAGTARPPSIVNCSRPTAPPPRPPPEAANEQNESTVETEENIYAVIEEHPTDEPSPPVNTSVLNRNAISTNRPNSGGNGLLDEIVNEMQARNLTSICRPDDQLYVNGGSGESSSGYLKPIKSSTHQRPSSSSNTNSIVTSVPKLSVPEKSAPGYRPFNASKKPTPPVFKPATNSSQCASSSVSAAISKYNETSSSKSHSPVSKRKPTVTVATKSANSSELKEPVKLAKASHVASMHKKFEAQSKFVPAKRGPTS